jgi:hypothetical protein
MKVMYGCDLLGCTQVAEDLSYVVMLHRKFGYLESIPGVLLPHPSSPALPAGACGSPVDVACWPPGPVPPPMEFYDPYYAQTTPAPVAAHQMHVMPSMSSLEALMSKLPSVGPAAAGGMDVVAKEEVDAAERDEMDDEGSGAAPAAATLSYCIDVAKPGDGF